MPVIVQPEPNLQAENLLLRELPIAERRRLLACCELVRLELTEHLCQIGGQYEYLYFPLTAFVSLIGKVAGHPPLEMGLIGFDGVLGASVVLASRQVLSDAVVQGAGLAWRLPVGQAEQLLAESTALKTVMQHYLFRLEQQLYINALCVHFHQVEARLARWLLMSQDRVGDSDLFFTHQFLADMLGVRRSSVTVAAGELQDSGVIHYSRGRVQIKSRSGLLARSCCCYLPIEPCAENR